MSSEKSSRRGRMDGITRPSVRPQGLIVVLLLLRRCIRGSCVSLFGRGPCGLTSRMRQKLEGDTQRHRNSLDKHTPLSHVGDVFPGRDYFLAGSIIRCRYRRRSSIPQTRRMPATKPLAELIGSGTRIARKFVVCSGRNVVLLVQRRPFG